MANSDEIPASQGEISYLQGQIQTLTKKIQSLEIHAEQQQGINQKTLELHKLLSEINGVLHAMQQYHTVSKLAGDLSDSFKYTQNP